MQKLPQSVGSHLPDQMRSNQEDPQLYFFVYKCFGLWEYWHFASAWWVYR